MKKQYFWYTLLAFGIALALLDIAYFAYACYEIVLVLQSVKLLANSFLTLSIAVGVCNGIYFAFATIYLLGRIVSVKKHNFEIK